MLSEGLCYSIPAHRSPCSQTEAATDRHDGSNGSPDRMDSIRGEGGDCKCADGTREQGSPSIRPSLRYVYLPPTTRHRQDEHGCMGTGGRRGRCAGEPFDTTFAPLGLLRINGGAGWLKWSEVCRFKVGQGDRYWTLGMPKFVALSSLFPFSQCTMCNTQRGRNIAYSRVSLVHGC